LTQLLLGDDMHTFSGFLKRQYDGLAENQEYI